MLVFVFSFGNTQTLFYHLMLIFVFEIIQNINIMFYSFWKCLAEFEEEKNTQKKTRKDVNNKTAVAATWLIYIKDFLAHRERERAKHIFLSLFIKGHIPIQTDTQSVPS